LFLRAMHSRRRFFSRCEKVVVAPSSFDVNPPPDIWGVPFRHSVPPLAQNTSQSPWMDFAIFMVLFARFSAFLFSPRLCLLKDISFQNSSFPSFAPFFLLLSVLHLRLVKSSFVYETFFRFAFSKPFSICLRPSAGPWRLLN